MKLLNRTLLVLLFAIVTMGWTAQGSLAAEKEPIPPVSPAVIQINDIGDELEKIQNDITPFSTQYIRSGYSSIEFLTGSTIQVSGSTHAYTSVSTIRVALYLQQWNPAQSKWVDVLTLGPASNNNTNLISYSRQVNIVKGYSYRVKAQHDVIHNGVIEQLTSISNKIDVK
jgi:hypothetical protein